jgi:Tol biopolymer transport system component
LALFARIASEVGWRRSALYSAHALTLTAGTRLGPYEILSPIGAGGMGEVYKARDTRLERTVAVKVLPAHTAASPEVRQRFEREARAISQLSHPHICALYDVGREGDTDYLVMELLEGESLAARLGSGPLALDQICRYGAEIADALGAAHSAGVVHRDLKPGNVMLTKSGVKLLDFGLAKALAPADGSAARAVTSLPTEAKLTQEGTILGTFQYMAPEQLEGKPADARTDIFALGSTLYEMAAGRPAFAGDTPMSVASAILRSEPRPMAEAAPMTPPALDRLVRRCLAKDPEERWQSARDVAAELRFLRSEVSSPGRAPLAARAPRVSLPRALPWAIALLAVAAAAWLARPRPTPPVRRFRLAVEKLTPSLPLGYPALSPDGTRIAYRADGRLWIRDLDRFEAREVPGTEKATTPFWSFDGRNLAYVFEKKLWRVPTAGGEATAVCSVPERGQLVGAAWSRYGRIVFGVWRGSLYEVAAAGGEAKRIVALGAGAEDFHTPVFLPDGRTVIYAVHGSRDDGKIAVLPEGGTPRIVYDAPYLQSVAYSPTGHLLYGREIEGEGIWAVPFSASKLKVEGAAIPVVRGAEFPSLAADGSLVYLQGRVEAKREMVWVSRDGKIEETVGEPQRGLGGPMVSPDGGRVAFAALSEESADVWIQDLSRGTRTRVTSGKTQETSPAWLPSGDRLLYAESEGMTEKRMVEVAADGTGRRRELGVGLEPQVTPDGRFVAYRTDVHGELTLWYRPLEGDGAAKVFLRTPGVLVIGPEFSRDGRWALYLSNETGRYELFVCRFPEGGEKTQISRNGSGPFLWSRRGDAIYYLRGDDLMEVVVRPGAAPAFGEPKALFSMAAAGLEVSSPWGDFNLDVSPDGRRFLGVRRAGSRGPAIFYVENWAADLAAGK